MRRSRSSRIVLLVSALAVGAVLAAACGSSSSSSGGSDSTTTTAGDPGADSLVGAWTLTSYLGDGAQIPAAANPATIQFVDDGTFNGNTGCNGMSGTWTGDVDGSLTIELGPMTQMACTDPGGQAQEQALTAGLPTVTDNEVAGTTLTLTGDAGSALFTWERGPEGIVGSYSVTGINDGNDAVVSSLATEAITVQFLEDGTVNGNTGCNSFSGTYETNGSSITVDSQMAQTMMACEGEAQQIEQEFLAALDAATTWERNGQVVTLRDSSGSTQLTLTTM